MNHVMSYCINVPLYLKRYGGHWVEKRANTYSLPTVNQILCQGFIISFNHYNILGEKGS